MGTSLEIALPPAPDGDEARPGYEGPPRRLERDLVVEAKFRTVQLTALGSAATK
jgi:hypothetical protein